MSTLAQERPLQPTHQKHEKQQTLIQFKRRDMDDFYEAVCKRVHTYFDKTGHNKYATKLIVYKGLFFGLLTIGSYVTLLLQITSPIVSLLLAVCCGLGLLGFLLNVAHDAAHGALTPNKFWNDMLLWGTFNILGVSGYLWKRRHIHSHHMFPNINGCDVDIDDNPVLRFSPNAPYKPWFLFQHMYAPFAYLIVQIHAVFFKDFLHLAKKDLANMHNIKHPPKEFFFFALCKICHIAIFFVIPILAGIPFPYVLLGYLCMSFVNSILFVLFFAGTHFADECIFPIRPEDGNIPLTYAEHAMLASLDWDALDPVSNFLVGGINAHAAHHLFPHVSHVHYPAITKIIAQAAKEYCIPYNQTSFGGMVKSHFQLLYKLRLKNPDLSQFKLAPSALAR